MIAKRPKTFVSYWYSYSLLGMTGISYISIRQQNVLLNAAKTLYQT